MKQNLSSTRKIGEMEYSVSELSQSNKKLKEFFERCREEIYNTDTKLLRSIGKTEAIKKILEERTSFLDDFYKEKISISLRVHCVLNSITSEAKFPKCDVCGKYKIFNTYETPWFMKICGRRPCMEKKYEEFGIEVTPLMKPLVSVS